MITHGTKTIKVFSSGKNPRIEVIRGYYLVLPNGDRHWMGETEHAAAKALDSMCNKYLSDAIGWNYWIDFCSGYDIRGNLQSYEVEAAA